jgi:hypothetical protein
MHRVAAMPAWVICRDPRPKPSGQAPGFRPISWAFSVSDLTSTGRTEPRSRTGGCKASNFGRVARRSFAQDYGLGIGTVLCNRIPIADQARLALGAQILSTVKLERPSWRGHRCGGCRGTAVSFLAGPIGPPNDTDSGFLCIRRVLPPRIVYPALARSFATC